jgi:hypothetical protein
MSVRAVNLKLVVPRQPGSLDSAQALWSTHDVVNRVTKFYEQMLLLCRRQDYLTRNQAYFAADQLPESDYCGRHQDSERRPGDAEQPDIDLRIADA